MHWYARMFEGAALTDFTCLDQSFQRILQSSSGDFHVGGSYRRSASFPVPAVSSPTRRRLAAGLDRKDATVARGRQATEGNRLLIISP